MLKLENKKYFFIFMEDIFNRKWLTNDGYYLKKLETEISNFIGVKHSIENHANLLGSK